MGERLQDGKQRTRYVWYTRLHPYVRSGPDVTSTGKRNGIGKEGNERDIVSQMLLQEGGRHILLTATL